MTGEGPEGKKKSGRKRKNTAQEMTLMNYKQLRHILSRATDVQLE